MGRSATRRARWFDVVAGVVVLAVLIGVGRIALVDRDDSAPDPRGSAAQPASAAAFSPAEQKIVGLLPPGYSVAACARAADPFQDAVASLDCTQNSGSDDPTYARFTLYEDLDALTGDFQDTAGDMVQSPCPGQGPSGPGTWTLDAKGGQIGGKIVCGMVDDRANIAWTRDAQLLLATVNGGADLGDLYKWWRRYGATSQQ